MSLEDLCHEKIEGEPVLTETDETVSNPYEKEEEKPTETVKKTVSEPFNISKEDERNSRLVSKGMKRLFKVEAEEDKDLIEATSDAFSPLFGLCRVRFGLWGLLGCTSVAVAVAWLPRVLDMLAEETS